jgi:hypothetical protein
MRKIKMFALTALASSFFVLSACQNTIATCSTSTSASMPDLSSWVFLDGDESSTPTLVLGDGERALTPDDYEVSVDPGPDFGMDITLHLKTLDHAKVPTILYDMTIYDKNKTFLGQANFYGTWVGKTEEFGGLVVYVNEATYFPGLKNIFKVSYYKLTLSATVLP